MKLIPLLPLLLAPVFFLAACSDDTPPLILGPQKAYIVPQLQEEFQFLPGRTDAGAEITDARITGVGGKVVLNPDTQKLVLTFQAGFAATNGPANHGGPVTLTYFVTVSEGEDIISKDEYNITLHFDGHNNVAVGTSPPITLKFPNERDDPPAEVLVGLQMTDEQAAYTATHVAMP